jgi:cell division protein FtsL
MNLTTRILTPKEDLLRHQILAFAFQKAYGSPKRTLYEKDIAVPLKEIAGELNKPIDSVHYAGLSLQENEVKFGEFNEEICVIADKDTFSAYTSKKYLHQGKQKRISQIKDILSITVAVIAIASAIYTAFATTKKNEVSRMELEELKKEIKAIKSTLP